MNFSKPLNVSSIEISQTNNFSTSTVTFNYSGALSIFPIPSNVYLINIQATGASGGTGGNGSESFTGGNGAVVNSFFRVTPNSTLAVLVGQQGGSGTLEGAAVRAGGGGGGGSFVWFGSNFSDIGSQFLIQNNLLVAAGGGGGGAGTPGVDASTTTSGTIDNTPS